MLDVFYCDFLYMAYSFSYWFETDLIFVESCEEGATSVHFIRK